MTAFLLVFRFFAFLFLCKSFPFSLFIMFHHTSCLFPHVLYCFLVEVIFRAGYRRDTGLRYLSQYFDNDMIRIVSWRFNGRKCTAYIIEKITSVFSVFASIFLLHILRPIMINSLSFPNIFWNQVFFNGTPMSRYLTIL